MTLMVFLNYAAFYGNAFAHKSNRFISTIWLFMYNCNVLVSYNNVPISGCCQSDECYQLRRRTLLVRYLTFPYFLRLNEIQIS